MRQMPMSLFPETFGSPYLMIKANSLGKTSVSNVIILYQEVNDKVVWDFALVACVKRSDKLGGRDIRHFRI